MSSESDALGAGAALSAMEHLLELQDAYGRTIDARDEARAAEIREETREYVASLPPNLRGATRVAAQIQFTIAPMEGRWGLLNPLRMNWWGAMWMVLLSPLMLAWLIKQNGLRKTAKLLISLVMPKRGHGA